jgi:hypothetical protein
MKEYLTSIYFIGRLKGQADIAQSWQHHWKEFGEGIAEWHTWHIVELIKIELINGEFK